MYHHSQNINKDENVLPRSKQIFLRGKSQENVFAANLLDSSKLYNDEDDDVQSNFLANEDRKQCRINDSQHTYGAYTNSTLPRGPYLQYKYNDRQATAAAAAVAAATTTNKFNLYNGHIDSVSTSPTIDNNNLRQKQIEQLKKEFFLPRVHVSPENVCKTTKTDDHQQFPVRSSSSSLSSSSKAWFGSRDFGYNYNYGRSSNETSKKDCENGAYNVQTLGRYEKRIKSKKSTTIACNAVSNSAYFYSSSGFINAKSDNIQSNYFNEHENIQNPSAVQSQAVQKLANDQCRPTKRCSENLRISSSSNKSSNGSESGVDVNKYSCKGTSTIHKQTVNNLVFLSDVIKTKANGLTQTEGWALLCQSVQALQDLFLSDTSVTNRIIPLVHPSNLQITSRGRVVFSILPSGQMNSLNDITSYISFLPPEYLNNIGKKITFIESDVEKMWIYSLGITLRRAVHTFSTGTNQQASAAVTNPSNNKNPTSLECVIRAMCAPNIYYRASLMYLLNVISQYCRLYHQTKPFSHVVINLYKDVVYAMNFKSTSFKTDENKSDTDSGRSSINGEKEIIERMLIVPKSLRVTRCTDDKLKTMLKSKASKVDAIGFDNDRVNHNADRIKSDTHESRLKVANRKNIILKKRNLQRRNTIEFSHFNGEWQPYSNLSKSKLMDCDGKMDSVGTSMPDLGMKDKFATFPKLNVRRCSRIIVGENEDNNNRSNEIPTKSKGAEFILNSSLPCQEIDISEQNCPYRRVINVLLLNGRSINITCSGTTTTARHIFETVLNTENLTENFFLGLCALVGGDFVFLPLDSKICKFAPQVWNSISKKSNYNENIVFTLFVRIKYFLPNLREISIESRHLLYLQLRKSILESQILCNDDDLIQLGGLALQAEIGDFQHSMKFTNYFSVSYYLPEGVYQRHKEMAKYLRNSHFCKRGLHSKEAEQQFIRYVQQLKEYGLHLYSAIWTNESNIVCNVYVAISLNGIAILERSSQSNRDKDNNNAQNMNLSCQRKVYESFDWHDIENLCYSKHILYVVARKSDGMKAKENHKIKYKFKMDGKKSYLSFYLASEHHRFYMRLRDSFISIQHIANELNMPLLMGQNAVKNNDIFPGDYEMSKADKSLAGTQQEATVTENNIKIIDKHIKTAGVRARNSKKSMLNDNKLIRLRNKLLRRTKSTVAISSKCQPQSHASEHHCDNGNSIEAFQNKENEQPKLRLNHCGQSENFDATTAATVVQTSPPKIIMSPNRNRVKMGTRVFSSQFLNKSLDNIYDNAMSAMSVYHSDADFENSTNMRNQSTTNQNPNNTDQQCAAIDRECMDGCTTDSSSAKRCLSDDRYLSSTTDVDRMSLKSSSLSSIQCSETMGAIACESPSAAEQAYVIQSTINGSSDAHYYSFQNETISDTLLDKFSNMTTTQNSQSDRIITRITIVKDQNNSMQHKARKHRMSAPLNFRAMTSHEHNDMAELVYHNHNHNMQSIAEYKQDSGMSLGISVVQGSDNNVYVKDLMKSGPGERHGVLIGDQILAVNGKSLLNMPYEESLKLLQNTGNVVELTVSQIFAKYQQKQQQQQSITTLYNNDAHKINSMGKSIEASHVQNYKIDENQKMMAHFGENWETHQYDHKNQDKMNKLTCLAHDDYDNNNHGTNVTILQIGQMNNFQCGAQGAVNSYSQFNEFNETKSLPKRGFKHNPASADALNSSSRFASDNCSVRDKVVGIPKKPKTIPKTAKKYRGHAKYPVTPTRADIIGKNRTHCLSLLSDDDEQDVHI